MPKLHRGPRDGLFFISPKTGEKVYVPQHAVAKARKPSKQKKATSKKAKRNNIKKGNVKSYATETFAS